MELRHALRTTPAVREFTDREIDDTTLASILDDARFAPSGGNRQSWRVVVLKDPARRRAMREIYLRSFHEYLAQGAAGLTPFSVFNSPEEEAAALALAPPIASDQRLDGFVRTLDQVPALVLVLADLRLLATVDRDLDRYHFAGGASVYPFAWSILLAARARGLGGVLTTMPIRHEQEVLDLVGAPQHLALATMLALGEPVREVTRLRRAEVTSFTTIDSIDGPALPDPG